ncbi:MAG: hypothetical protein IPK81_04990 [Rhodospirillales bacterium]|nr:MAG: hypothetical protein IPK81_04990 [Rhodospirillales bacterium]
MARILFAWELGGGTGYADRLRAIADAVALEGHEPVFAIRDLIGTAEFFRDRPWIVMQSPLAVGQLHPTNPNFVPGSYADLLAVNNFLDPEHLYRLVHAWQMLFLALQPSLIVGEYAPVATVAAHGRIPMIVTGHGYLVPPVERPEFPIFDAGAPRFAPQERLVETMRAVQRRLGGAVADTLTEVIGGARHFVTSFAETDPYAAFRLRAHAGPLERYDPPEPPSGPPSFHAYLSASHPRIRMLLESLVESGVRGGAYIKRATPEIRQYLSERGVTVYDRPPPLAEAVKAASVVVHHGGASTLAAAMGAGRPQLLWPEVADQQVSANTIDRLGISVHGRRRLHNAAQASAALREMAQSGEATTRAMALARDIQSRGEHGSLGAITAAAREFLG